MLGANRSSEIGEISLKSHWLRLQLAAIVCFVIGCLLVISPAQAGYLGGYSGQIFYENFDDFRGDGLIQQPNARQLDSDRWRVTGLSEADGVFGGGYLSGDWTRGAATGSVITGGVYAFQIGSESTENWAIGFQQTAGDLTPGTLTLRVVNATTESVQAIDVGFQVLFRNNANRSSVVSIDYGFNDRVYFGGLGGGWLSDAEAANAAQWVSHSYHQTISGFSLAPSEAFYLRWSFDDFGGNGSRDEIAIDNVSLDFQASASPVPAPSAAGSLLLICGNFLLTRKRFHFSRAR